MRPTLRRQPIANYRLAFARAKAVSEHGCARIRLNAGKVRARDFNRIITLGVGEERIQVLDVGIDETRGEIGRLVHHTVNDPEIIALAAAGVID